MLMKDSCAIEAESLYYRLYESYLLQTPNLIENYEMLKALYKRQPQSFQYFTKNDILRIKQIQDDIWEGKFSLFSGEMDLTTEIPESLRKEKSAKKHKEICTSLIKHRLLDQITGKPDLISMEHPTRFGLIDIMVIANNCAYIFEIKTSSATHDIIGQVQKYYIGMSLKLILKFFDEVKLITLCPGYDSASYHGLKQLGAKTMLISSNPMEIKEL